MTTATATRVGYLGARGHVLPDVDAFLPLVNPATGEAIGEAYEVSTDDVDRIVEQATEAQRVWRWTAPEVRGAHLRAWADAIAAHADELTDLEVADTGHLRAEAGADVASAARVLTYYAGLADKLQGETYAQVPGRLAYGVDEPHGVVAGINPYNANPVFIGLKAGPALVAGNAIVLKAAELAPLSSFRIGELALEAGLPAGLVSVVTGRGEVMGPLLAEHPGIGMVSFTGGPGAGRAVIGQSARNIVPLVLELGGKSPAILLPDADLRTALPSVLQSNFVKSGQSCVAASRILVHDTQYEQVCQELGRRAAAIRVGLPTEGDSQMGSLISAGQRERVDALVQRAIGAGATCLAGGSPAGDGALAGGAFYRPTVLADVADDNPAAQTEAFGPMASVLRYADVDEALARANNTPFGLSSQIWGNDAATIQYLVQRLEAGSVWVNAHRAMHPTVPAGGVGQSGYGREFGIAAVVPYTRRKSVVWDLTIDRQLPYS